MLIHALKSTIVFSLLWGLLSCKGGDAPGLSPGALEISGVPPIPDSLGKKLARYQNSRSSTLVDWAPDGAGIVFIRRDAETGQLYSLTRPGDTMRRLTALSEPVIHASVCPDPARKCVLFSQDSGGDEQFRIYALDLATLGRTRLTYDKAQNDGMIWSNRGDRFVYSSNRRNGRDFDIYLAAVDRPGRDSLLVSEGGAWSAADWSPGDRELLLERYVSRTSSLLFAYELTSGRLTALADSSDTVSQELGLWSGDGRGVFYTSDAGTDFRCLRFMDRATRRESLLTNRIPWDVREIALSKDRKELAFTTNENGFSRLYLMDAATFAYRPASSLPAGIIGGLKFHPSGRFLAMTVTTPQMPEDVHVLDCSTLSAVRWTQGRGCGAPPETFVMPELVRYPSFDSVGGSPRLIPCLVYKPVKRTGPHPVLISIHGGPESQFWPSFRPEIQFFLDAFGIAVVAPNVRGSGGYGKSWLSLDNGYKREDAVRDIGRLLDWIARQPDLDSARIAVMGGSYGGYMALSSLEHFGNRLRAGIDHYGISNFITFLEHTAPYRRDLRRVEYGDERDSAMRAFLLTISPVTRARRITKPLLILQGANDARVPLAESRQIADTLRSAGGTVWFIVAGDEGHGFRRKSNRDYLECATALFLDRFLLGDAFR